MRRLQGIFLGVLTALSLCAGVWAAGPTGGRTPIDPWTYQALLGMGMDVDWCKTAAGKPRTAPLCLGISAPPASLMCGSG